MPGIKSLRKQKGGTLSEISDMILSSDAYINQINFSHENVKDIINQTIIMPIHQNFSMIRDNVPYINIADIRVYDVDNDGKFDRNEIKMAIEAYLDWLSSKLEGWDKTKWLRLLHKRLFPNDRNDTKNKTEPEIKNIISISLLIDINQNILTYVQVRDIISSIRIMIRQNNLLFSQMVPAITIEKVREYDINNRGGLNLNQTKLAIEEYIDFLSTTIVNWDKNKWIKIIKKYVQVQVPVPPPVVQMDMLVPVVVPPPVVVPVPVPAPVPAYPFAPPVVVRVPVPAQARELDLNGVGNDVINTGQQNILEFIQENVDDGSVIIKVFDSVQHSEIFLFNKQQFIENMLIPENTVYACARAGSMANINMNTQYLSLARVIGRRLIVNNGDFVRSINNTNINDIFILLTKTPRTVPSIASYNVVHHIEQNYVGALHCAGAEAEEIWMLTLIQPANVRGGKTKKRYTKSNIKGRKSCKNKRMKSSI